MSLISTPPEPAVTSKLPTLDARDLIVDGSHIGITLDDQQYVLRITRAGKLIPTK